MRPAERKKSWQKQYQSIIALENSEDATNQQSPLTDNIPIAHAPTTPAPPPLPSTGPISAGYSQTPAAAINPFSNPYGQYGGYAGTSGYGAGYNRLGFGGMNGMYGNPMGGYGMPGYGVGGYGQPGLGPDGLPSLTQQMTNGTAATFQIIQSIIAAFGGFAQMLDSTFVATQSSFFAMIGVAEQFGRLRVYLGDVLSIFSLLRWAKSALRQLTGRQDRSIEPSEFAKFQASNDATSISGQPNIPLNQPSRKPLIFFFLAVFGIPYLMNKLVGFIASQPSVSGIPPPIDPNQVTFVRALHAFESKNPSELPMKENEIIAVLSKDPGGEWWHGRSREGAIGWFPSNRVAAIPQSAPKTTSEASQHRTGDHI